MQLLQHSFCTKVAVGHWGWAVEHKPSVLPPSLLCWNICPACTARDCCSHRVV